MEYSELYVRRIRQLCKDRGIAINKLATMSGINQSTIDNIVRGLTKNPRVMTLHKIAIAFNMTVAPKRPIAGRFLVVERNDKDRKSTRLNSSHPTTSRMPSSA